MRKPILVTLPNLDPHPYRVRIGGTQCIRCLGWVDDPRHTYMSPTMAPRPRVRDVGPYAQARQGSRADERLRRTQLANRGLEWKPSGKLGRRTSPTAP